MAAARALVPLSPGRIAGGGLGVLLRAVSCQTELRDQLFQEIETAYNRDVKRQAKAYLDAVDADSILVAANADVDRAYTAFQSMSSVCAKTNHRPFSLHPNFF